MTDKTTTSFTNRVKSILKRIPRGKVTTYGRIAALAGDSHAARQVVRILHSCSRKDNLPWHRVVNSKGTISLRPGQGYELQKSLLEKEGVGFGLNDVIDFKRFLWNQSRDNSDNS